MKNRKVMKRVLVIAIVAAIAGRQHRNRCLCTARQNDSGSDVCGRFK